MASCFHLQKRDNPSVGSARGPLQFTFCGRNGITHLRRLPTTINTTPLPCLALQPGEHSKPVAVVGINSHGTVASLADGHSCRYAASFDRSTAAASYGAGSHSSASYSGSGHSAGSYWSGGHNSGSGGSHSSGSYSAGSHNSGGSSAGGHSSGSSGGYSGGGSSHSLVAEAMAVLPVVVGAALAPLVLPPAEVAAAPATKIACSAQGQCSL